MEDYQHHNCSSCMYISFYMSLQPKQGLVFTIIQLPINHGTITNNQNCVCSFLMPSISYTTYNVLFFRPLIFHDAWRNRKNVVTSALHSIVQCSDCHIVRIQRINTILLFSVQIINSYLWKIGDKYITMDNNPEGKLVANLSKFPLSSDHLSLLSKRTKFLSNPK